MDVDPRFTMANERTFLAWIRTGLGFVTAGLAVTLFFQPFDIQYGRRAIGVPLILIGAIIGLQAHREWRGAEAALRRGDPLPRSWLGPIVAFGLSVTAAVAIILLAFEGE